VFERLRATLFGVLAALGAASDAERAPAWADGEQARLVALVTEPALDEISGLAVSRRHPDLLWTHNDSGDAAQIYALGTDGNLRATVQLRGAANVDFEDIAGFELDGEAWLLVGDIGDNGGVRDELQLYLLREPAAIADGPSEPVTTLRFRWPDGARDAEGLAVDPERREILLASKRRVPAELFRLPLRMPGDPVATDELMVAERIGLFDAIPQPTIQELHDNPRFGRYRAQVTGLDLSPDGTRLAVLTYRQAYLYTRRSGEDWPEAIRRAPRELAFPWLAQAEAIAFDRDGGSVWVSSERLPAPLLQLRVVTPAR
jgi:hypothetical protein